MKILMVISEAPPIRSGIARVADKLSRGLRELGYQVDQLSLNDIPRYEWGEVRLSSMPLRLPGLREQLQDYDFINLHGPVPTFSDAFLLMGLRGLKTPRPRLIYTHHAPIELTNKLLRPAFWAYNLAQEHLARLADHVVATTPSYGQRLSRRLPPEKLSIIPWGVDYDRYFAPVKKDGPFTAIYLGQIRPYKGLPVLLKAATGLEGVRLWVVGNGHSSPEYQEMARNLGVKDITFWGAQTDQATIQLLKQAHVIVLPSVTRSEAFGIVLLEGMAAGLVPVASHLPGVADVVGNEGLTFQPGNHAALQAALVRLRDDPALRQHLAGLAQAKANLYSWERVVFGYDRVFSHFGPLQRAVHPEKQRSAPYSSQVTEPLSAHRPNTTFNR